MFLPVAGSSKVFLCNFKLCWVGCDTGIRTYSPSRTCHIFPGEVSKVLMQTYANRICCFSSFEHRKSIYQAGPFS